MGKPIGDRFVCVDCAADTAELDEYYMVHDHVWAQAGMGCHDGMLCIGCIESRLGRTLVADDFKDVIVNIIGSQSQRLRDRLTLQ